MKFQAPKGTRDFLLAPARLRKNIINTLENVYSLYGFEPWDGPAFEYLNLLTKKSGEAVKKEIYVFSDKAGRKLGLRFELTASLARMIAQNPSLAKPLKLYNIGKVWRYERPQSGRYREFIQADADILGVSEVTAEIELLGLAKTVLEKLGFSRYQIILSDRQIVSKLLSYFNLPKQDFVLRTLDKLSKIGQKETLKELVENNIPAKKAQALIQFLTQKENNQAKLRQTETLLGQKKDIKQALERLKQISRLIPEVIIDFSLVRGLDYYTSTIFEIKLLQQETGSIAGGGRYDNLVADFGGTPTAACGLSFGVERIYEIKRREKYLDFPTSKVFVAYPSAAMLGEALKIAQKFRQAGINTDLNLQEKNLTQQLKYADSKKIPYLFIVFSPQETKLKNMATGKEEILTLEQAIKKLTGELA